ncbi:serine hydrolase domain-containing protein [Streptomyces venezuelae]|uniref:serine hydrolase domain-containing protein n=1 Tax=Streptomyces venezuelae TaxID=54571 RepID=UPI00331B43AE
MTSHFSTEATTEATTRATTGGTPAVPAAPAAATPDRSAMQTVLDRAAAPGGTPGIVVEVRDRRGAWFGSAGVSDTASGEKRHPSERFRIGSTTKAFTATLVLQLAAEGRLSLDDTMERWLPGMVTGNGYDGRSITIRHLLNHTSGIFNYGNDAEFFKKGIGAEWFQHRYDSHTPAQLIGIGLATPAPFAPGEAFLYSNTNYFLAALIVEKVTGGTLAEALTQRIADPLALTGTYLPGEEPTIRGPHPRHYSTLFASETPPRIHDATEMNQSFAWAAGGIISTTGDLQRFFGALLGGRLLPAEQQREMFTTVDTTGPVPWIPGTGYGLGVFSWTLPSGVTVWGNAGATYGSWTCAMGSRDGEHLLTSQLGGDWCGLAPFVDVLGTEFGPAAGN